MILNLSVSPTNNHSYQPSIKTISPKKITRKIEEPVSFQGDHWKTETYDYDSEDFDEPSDDDKIYFKKTGNLVIQKQPENASETQFSGLIDMKPVVDEYIGIKSASTSFLTDGNI